MLAKRYHLPIQSAASGASRSVRSSGLMIKVFSTNLPYGRFGVIIPKAVVKTAVQRNKLKRAAFDAFALSQGTTSRRDVLCILSKGAPLTKDGMMKELAALLGKITN